MNLNLPSNYQDPVPHLDFLVLCAHPGDAEQTTGGTLIKLAELGYRTGVLDLTPGDVTRAQKTEAMFAHATAAAAPLLLTWRGNLHYPDGRVENSLPGRMTVAGEIRRLRPRLVIVPYWQGQHPDHPATCEMAEQACELAGLQGLDAETPAHRPERIYHASLYAAVAPTFVVDITAQFERKVASMACYRAPDQAALRDRLHCQARFYGDMIGARYGEPFVSRSPLRIGDPLGAL
ncbi:MAG: PIG-L family deacetylase [Bryobacteraceae bacterium]|nr:PIG-L family deacetylase [Bryobacteraceae bacterium]